MTLQVGMIGAKGIAIVGDTWRYEEPQNEFWFGYPASKIEVSSSGRIVAACARELKISANIANAVFAQISVDSDDRRSKILEIGTSLGKGHASECLIAFANTEPSLYRFVCNTNGDADCEEISSYFPIGDTWNPAVFLLMQHYNPRMSIRQLVRLGALTVTIGGRLNSGTIKGLEVVTCTNEGIERWSRQDNQTLEDEAENLISRIGEFIRGSGEAES